jgi:hypothetical protein
MRRRLVLVMAAIATVADIATIAQAIKGLFAI